MQWTEFTVSCSYANAEAVAVILHGLTGGVVVENRPDGVVYRAYAPEGDASDEVLKKLNLRFGELPAELTDDGIPHITTSMVPEEDWAQSWKAHFKPLRVGRRLVIRPTWQPWPPEDNPAAARPDDMIIELDPGMAFGTGTHPTTRMCMRALERWMKPGASVVDAGCGSGILTVTAMLLGAERVLAFDNDPICVDVTRANVRQNNLPEERADVHLADSLDIVKGQWDVVVCNISVNVVRGLIPHVPPILKPGGLFVTTGFYVGWADELIGLLQEHGLELVDSLEEELWSCLVVRSREH